MNNPIISVGIPVYNHASQLNRALLSVQAQSRLPDEILISDNCSEDNTREIAEQWMGKIPNTRYVKQSHNIGALANMLFLAQACRGDYFLWLAADDVLEPQCIETVHDFLRSHPQCEMVGWSHTTYNYCTNTKSVSAVFPDVKLCNSKYQNCRNYLSTCISSYAYSLFKRQYILKSPAYRWNLSNREFDWMDCAFVMDSLLTLNSHFLSDKLAIFGIDAPSRPLKNPRGQIASPHYQPNGKAWLMESVKIILSATTLTPIEKAKLLLHFWNTWRAVTKHVQSHSDSGN